MKRREFIKGSVAASSMAAVALQELISSAAERGPAGNQEYYELRAYRLKSGADRALLDAYLEKATIPALNRLGIKPVGVFMQQERAGAPAGSEIRDPNALFVLIPHPSSDSLATAATRLHMDAGAVVKHVRLVR